MRSLHIITVITVIIFMRNHVSDLTKCSLLIQAHRNFFGTSLLVSERGGEWKGCQKAFMVVQCLAQGTTAGDRESNRFWFKASRYWPPILREQSISVSLINYYNTCTDRSKSRSQESRQVCSLTKSKDLKPSLGLFWNTIFLCIFPTGWY